MALLDKLAWASFEGFDAAGTKLAGATSVSSEYSNFSALVGSDAVSLGSELSGSCRGVLSELVVLDGKILKMQELLQAQVRIWALTVATPCCVGGKVRHHCPTPQCTVASSGLSMHLLRQPCGGSSTCLDRSSGRRRLKSVSSCSGETGPLPPMWSTVRFVPRARRASSSTSRCLRHIGNRPSVSALCSLQGCCRDATLSSGRVQPAAIAPVSTRGRRRS